MKSIKYIFTTSKISKNNVYIVAAKRTPIGSFMGKISHLNAIQLASNAIKGTLDSIQLNPNQVDQVIMGNVLSAGLGQGPARQASLLSGIPITTPCTTINNLCSSGLKSLIFGSQSISLGISDCVITGGFQSMSNTPFIFPSIRNPQNQPIIKLLDTLTNDLLINPFNKINIGLSSQKTAIDFNITRSIQDQFCKLSYQRIFNSIKIGICQQQIIPITGKIIDKQQYINYDQQPQRYNQRFIQYMPPIYSKKGTITAGNSSKLNDGACAILLMSQSKLKQTKLSPLAKIIAYADASTQPLDFSTSSYYSIKKVLNKTKMDIKDINYFEFNQTFAIICLVNMQLLNIPIDKVNINGGSIALGHPIAMTGAKIIQSLLSTFKIKGGKYGLAATCNADGGSTAMIIQNML